MTVEDIAREFDISLSAARIRADELARIQRAKSGKLRPLPPGVLEFLRDQKKKGFVIQSAIEDR